jgi:hypothetical protein
VVQHRLRTTAFLVAIAVFALVAMHRTTAGTEECQDAIDSYNSARSDVFDALKAYASCVSGSDGQDDCGTEFSNLSNAQDDFDSAVSDYEGNCG